jgi:hypothetical protein
MPRRPFVTAMVIAIVPLVAGLTPVPPAAAPRFAVSFPPQRSATRSTGTCLMIAADSTNGPGS